jgi:hypothetical protein
MTVRPQIQKRTTRHSQDMIYIRYISHWKGQRALELQVSTVAVVYLLLVEPTWECESFPPRRAATIHHKNKTSLTNHPCFVICYRCAYT